MQLHVLYSQVQYPPPIESCSCVAGVPVDAPTVFTLMEIVPCGLGSYMKYFEKRRMQPPIQFLVVVLCGVRVRKVALGNWEHKLL